MRLFVGLDLPANVVSNLERLVEHLRPTARIQWSAAANLHITTKFIGEWPEQGMAELEKALRGVPLRPPITVRIRQLGFFPNPRAPRVFWAGVEAPALMGLAVDTDRVTTSLGIASESRAFSPHLTLARIRERLNLDPLRKAIEGLASVEFGEFQAASFFLYRSQLRRGGSVYTKLAEFPLAK
jgi:RNA 2',3'-cyclic 3'-phosphodiesterase